MFAEELLQAAAGIGMHTTLIDLDTFEPENLPSQVGLLAFSDAFSLLQMDFAI